MTELRRIMERLRDPESGCPWDREQTFASLVPHTLEEAYEVADCIEQNRLDELPDELGDLLFQVVFYCRIAEEEGRFDFEAVAGAIADKLVRRHPHVFGDAAVGDSTDQSRAWEAHKEQERRARSDGDGPDSLLDGVDLALPALSRSVKLQRRAARGGFDWPDIAPIYAKLAEEVDEARAEIEEGSDPQRVEDEVGDVLFAATNLARHAGVDPETALRRANARFEKRFRRIEALLAEQGKAPADVSLDELEALWQRAKSEEKAGRFD